MRGTLIGFLVGIHAAIPALSAPTLFNRSIVLSATLALSKIMSTEIPHRGKLILDVER